MSSLTVSYLAERIDARLAEGKAVDTVAGNVRVVKTWLRWIAGRGWISNTLVGQLGELKVEGPRAQGKDQLTVDEARLYLAAGFALDQKVGDPCDGPTVALLQLVTGLRSREILDRQVRDLDDQGCRLIIQRGKTRRARRVVELPLVIQPLVQRWAQGKEPFDLLFAGSNGKAHYNSYLQDWVHRICEKAGVPKVCPHGLRGTFASLAEGAGVASHVVASTLGHADDRVTGRHYTMPEVRQAARGHRAWEVISGGLNLSPKRAIG